MARTPRRALARLEATLRDQAHAVSLAQLSAAGLDSRHAAAAARRRGGDAPRRGVYRLRPTDASLALRAWTGHLGLGTDSVVTGVVSLALQGAPIRVDDDTPTALVVPATRTAAIWPGYRLVRTTAPVARASTPPVPALPPLATPARSLADAAVEVSEKALLRLATWVCRRDDGVLVLRKELDLRRRFPGRAAFGRVVRSLEGEPVHAATERKVRAEIRRLGGRPAPGPFTIRDGERWVSQPDIAFPEITYGAQLDGPHHLIPPQPRIDRRQDRAAADLGWRIDRFGYEEVDEDPARVAAQICAVAAEQGHEVRTTRQRR